MNEPGSCGDVVWLLPQIGRSALGQSEEKTNALLTRLMVC